MCFSESALFMVSAGVFILVSSLALLTSSYHSFLCDYALFYVLIIWTISFYKPWMTKLLNLGHLPYDGILIFGVVAVVFTRSLPHHHHLLLLLLLVTTTVSILIIIKLWIGF